MKAFTFFAGAVLAVAVAAAPASAQEYLTATLGTVGGEGSTCLLENGDCYSNSPEVDFDITGHTVRFAWGDIDSNGRGHNETEWSIVTANADNSIGGRHVFADKQASMTSLFRGWYWGSEFYYGFGLGWTYTTGLRHYYTANDGSVRGYDKKGFHPTSFIEAGIIFKGGKDLDVVASFRSQNVGDEEYTREKGTSFTTFSVGPRWRY